MSTVFSCLSSYVSSSIFVFVLVLALWLPAPGYDIHTKALTPVAEKAVPAGAAMKFVEGGKLNFVIVGDFGAERTQNTKSGKSIRPAADFLVEAFEKTTGRKPEVLDARTDAEKIEAAKYWLLVGDSKYAREAAGLDWSGMPAHGYEIKTFPRGLAIVGFDSSLVDGWQMRPLAPALTSPGTEYGALDFCERFLGVRHYFPGEYGSLWPKCRDLTIAPVHYADAPYYAVHGNSWHYWVTFSTEEQMAKWRKYMGGDVRRCDTSYLRYWRQGSSRQLQGTHSPNPQVYAKDHPDRLRDIFYTSPSGKFWYNAKEHVGNFYDVTNLKFADLLVADWKKMYETGGRYHPGNMHEYASDTGVSFGVCDTYLPLSEIVENPVVRKLDLIRKSEREGPPEEAMRNVFGRFFRYLGESLERELPGKQLWLLVYYNTLYAPNDPRWKLPPNANIHLCVGDMPRKLPDAARTAKSVALAKSWYEALGGRPAEILYLYNADQDPISQAIVPELSGGLPKAFGKYFGRLAAPFDWGAGVHDMWHNFYSVYAHEKIQWNPDFDVGAALEEMWMSFCGPQAGPHMSAFHRQLKAMYVRYAVPTDALMPQYPPKELDVLARELKAACDATAPDSAEGRRVRLVADRWPKVFEAQRNRAAYDLPVYDLARIGSEDNLARAPAIPLVDPFGAAGGKLPVSLRLGWDEKGIHGLLDSRLKPMADPKRDCFANDSLEFFLVPGMKHEVEYQLVWDALGQTYTQSKRHLPVDQPADCSWKAPGSYWKPTVGPDRLTARFFVPFSAFGDVNVKPYDVWNGNAVFASRAGERPVYRGSAMTLGNWHNLGMFGYFRFAGRGDTLPRMTGRKVIDVANGLNSYNLRAWSEKPHGTDRGELRLTIGNSMGAGFSGIINWLRLEVNGIRSRDLVVQDGDRDSFLLNFDGAKVRLTPYMDDGSPLLKCRFEPAGGEPIRSCRVTVAAVPSKVARDANGKPLFNGNRRKIVSPKPGVWVLMDETFDGTSEEKGWGPSLVFADLASVANVKEDAGSSWTASVTFDLKPGFKTFRFGVLERDSVRQTNAEALATALWQTL